MPRRASSSMHPGALIGGAIAVVIVLVGGKMLLGKKSGGFDGVPRLDVQQYLENANSLRGNEYALEGTVDERFFRAGSQAHIVSIRVDGNAPEFVAIEVPSEFNNMNIEREQRYAFRVKVRDGGIPVATGINRL